MKNRTKSDFIGAIILLWTIRYYGFHYFYSFRKKSGTRSLFFYAVIIMAKEFARKFYSSKAWQECRNEYIKTVHYLCENCMRKGIYKPAEIVHHKIELTPMNIDNPELTLGFDNLEAVCRECHSEYHDIHSRWDSVNKRRRINKANGMRYRVGKNGEVTAV